MIVSVHALRDMNIVVIKVAQELFVRVSYIITIFACICIEYSNSDRSTKPLMFSYILLIQMDNHY